MVLPLVSKIVSWFWDDYGPTLGGIISATIVVVGALLGLYWWAWPKDSKGNALPCTQYVTTYIPEKIGNTTYIMPVQTCVAWASPSPATPSPKGG